ncbi:WD40 repeat-like protein [Pluteus cervinus]|uniref:WD40 repeat-like protein n=1 Tax=Pluteus cervinus TaxID=181527 RepID=A0ACD3ALR8_9AGAR|nr:WD40 repeat-like protein [Pluteus cervinus]
MDKTPGFRDDINRLVKQAAGLFEWCATFFRHIATSLNKERDLRRFLSGESKMEPLQGLYTLYDKILAGASDPKHREDTLLLRVILGLILITANNTPLSARGLCVFLQSDAQYTYENVNSVRNATRALHAVLYEDHASGDAICVYHPSFLDFLRDRIGSGVADWVGIDQLQRLAFKGCFLTLNKELKFNICRLESSSSLNKNIQNRPETIAAHVSESLQYSSLFWSGHLQGVTLKADDEGIKASVSGFLKSTKVLFWLEVLSLLNGNPEISSAAFDLERFVLSYLEAFESAPHIYQSALAWLPGTSQTLNMAQRSDSFSHLGMITNKEQHWAGARWVKHVDVQVWSVAYSPNGHYIAAGLDDGTVCIWDSHTGEAVHPPLTGHSQRVRSVVFSQDNQLLASGSADGTICIWNVAAEKPVATTPVKSDHISCVAFSPDGQRIASASLEIGVQIWDVNTGRTAGGEHGNPLKGAVDGVACVAWSQDGRCIASSTDDGLVRLWNAQSGEAIGRALKGHTAPVNSIAFSPDSTQIASSSDDGSIRLWDVMTGRELRMPLKDHGGPVFSVTFSPDSRSILSGSSDGTIRIWDVDTAATTDRPSQVHSDRIRHVVFSPDREYFASGSQDGRVCIWNAITGTARCEPFRADSSDLGCIVFSPDGHSIVTVSGRFGDDTIRVWDSRTGAELIEPIQLEVFGVGDLSVGFCPEGRRIVSWSDKTIHVWDGETGMKIKAFNGHTSRVHSASLFPGGGRVVSGSGKTLRIWDINTGEMIGEPLTGHHDSVLCVSVSHGQHIASGSKDTDVRIWDTETRQTTHVLQGHTGSITSISFSADGQYIVSGSSDRTIRIWNVETGEAVGNPLRGHSDGVKSVAFSPDNQRIVSCARDKTIRMWNAQISAATVESSSARTDKKSRSMHWNACCSRMEVADGWVKEGDKLLFWIPQRYREHFQPQLHFTIPARQFKTIKPEVDLACLYEYAGNKWAGIYKT